MLKKFWDYLAKKSDALISLAVFFIILSVLLSVVSMQKTTSYNEGYKQGQLDFQRGIVQWKNEDGLIWHLESKLE